MLGISGTFKAVPVTVDDSLPEDVDFQISGQEIQNFLPLRVLYVHVNFPFFSNLPLVRKVNFWLLLLNTDIDSESILVHFNF